MTKAEIVLWCQFGNVTHSHLICTPARWRPDHVRRRTERCRQG